MNRPCCGLRNIRLIQRAGISGERFYNFQNGIRTHLGNANGSSVLDHGVRIFKGLDKKRQKFFSDVHGKNGNQRGHKRHAFAPGLKSLEDATEIRRRVLMAFERAELEGDRERVNELLTFVVVGAGPTGVELAGALGEISRFTLNGDFRHVDPSHTRVILIEAGPRILPSFREDMSRAAARSLERLGVTIWTAKTVTDITADGVRLSGDEFLRARTVLWAAGVRASPLNATLEGELDRSGRVRVNPDLSLPGAPEIFVIGDQALCLQPNGAPVPGVAPAAIQQGEAAAQNILCDLRGRPRRPFRYIDKGRLATLGRAAAVAEIGRLRFAGFAAWLAWCFVHIFFLIGFRNRVLVLIQWMWSYVRFKRGARLILGDDRKGSTTCSEASTKRATTESPPIA